MSSTDSNGPGREREDDEAEVDLTALDQAEELAVVGRLDERHVDLRPLRRGSDAKQRREDARADALVRADPQRAGVAGAEGAQVGLGGTEAGRDPVGMREQELPASVSEIGLRAARPLDEALADDALEHCDLLADRRLRVAEPLRRAAERAFLGDGLERDQMPQLETHPFISLHNGVQH